MANPDKATLIALLDKVCEELKGEAPSPGVAQALHQSDRLRQSILQFHAEGLRFAAFTLARLMQQPDANLRESTRAAGRALQAALQAAGYTSQH